MAGNNQLEVGERFDPSVQGMLPGDRDTAVRSWGTEGEVLASRWDLGQLLVEWEHANIGAGCQESLGHQVYYHYPFVSNRVTLFKGKQVGKTSQNWGFQKYVCVSGSVFKHSLM